MSKPFLSTSSLCILASLLAAALGGSQAVDPGEKPILKGPPPPEELKVLTPVGQWKTETTVKPSLVHKEGFTAKGELFCRWIHNGHYLQLEARSLPQGGFESTEIIGYDRGAGQFRRFAFTTEGVMAQSVGDWDDKTRTLTWKGVNLPEGWSVVAKTVLEKNQTVFTLLVKNNRSEVVRDVILMAQRQKPAAKAELRERP